jgi:putative ABC transport system permease protein
MHQVAWKMLTGDLVKFLSLVVGVGFASFLMTQQVSIFMSILGRTGSQVVDVTDAPIWVMDAKVRFVDEAPPLLETDLFRVRGVADVDWAVPFYKGQVRVQLENGNYRNVVLLGIDDATFVGAPTRMVLGNIAALSRPDAVIVDKAGWKYLFGNDPYALGREMQLNDHRAVIVGICQASPPFTTLPIVYSRYSVAARFVPRERHFMNFVLAQPKPNSSAEQACLAIAGQTGLQALTRDQFYWKTVKYFLANTGIPINFGMTISLGFLIGAVVTGQTFYLFTVENIRHLGSLKAMGLTNRRIRGMIALQACLVGVLGYCLGIGGAALFFRAAQRNVFMEGVGVTPQAALLVALAVLVIILLTALLSVRRVIRLEPAEVFR